MYNITVRDIVCVYRIMVLTLYMVLCQLKKSNMVYAAVGGVGRIRGLRRIYIKLSLSSEAPPPCAPNPYAKAR